MFTIAFSSRAKKEYDRLQNSPRMHISEVGAKRGKIKEIFKMLAIDPVPARVCDVKKLRGLENTFRIRMGRMRIVYTIVWEDKTILISRISHRESAYD